jgi:hypothetical protein
MNRVVAVAALVVVVALGACSPLGGRGSRCDRGPCAAGLECNDEGLCDDPPAPPVPPDPPCVDAEDCPLNGDTSGRACVEGVCGFAECAFDQQCGARICVDGLCATPEVCVADDNCNDGQLCLDNVCRDPCLGDDDCGIAVGGISLNTCVDGRCLQRCLNDATCFGGGVCEGNICVEPACAVDDDCEGDTVLCNAGRCEGYTACATDPDCFDANLRCDTEVEPVRCVERPTCNNDAACGLSALCLDNHCRPVEGCFGDDDCVDASDECVGGRCVASPACRTSADCSADKACVNTRCVVTAPGTPDEVIVGDDAGVCEGCQRVLVVGEVETFTSQGFREQAPVYAPVEASSNESAIVGVDVDGVTFRLTANAEGSTSINGVFARILVSVVPAASLDDVLVLLVDDNGAPVADAAVDVGHGDGTQTTATTDALGTVRFAADDVVTVVCTGDDGRGVALVFDADEVLAGTAWRLMLPATTTVSTSAAPARLTITSTGDELGDVGLGLAVPAVSSINDVTLPRLFGDNVAGQLTLPVIGALPVTVSSAMSLEASLPLVGAQVVRANSDVVVVPGGTFALALEGRRDQGTLTSLALGGSLQDLVLSLLTESETLDVELVAFNATNLPLVPDSADRDNDGDTTEGVADFDGGAVLAVSPSVSPQERSSVVVELPGDVEQALLVAGYRLPNQLVPAGVSVLTGLVNFEGAPLAESFKVQSATAALSLAPRVVVVTALSDDDSTHARVLFRGDKLPTQQDLGAMPAAPTGSFLVDNLPAAGDRSVLVANGSGDLARAAAAQRPHRRRLQRRHHHAAPAAGTRHRHADIDHGVSCGRAQRVVDNAGPTAPRRDGRRTGQRHQQLSARLTTHAVDGTGCVVFGSSTIDTHAG